MLRDDPEYRRKVQAFEKMYQRILEEGSSKYTSPYLQGRDMSDCGGSSIVTIPIVIHVIQDGSGPATSLTDADVLQGISYLNKAFRNSAACFQDANSTDIEIEFCLAQRDICNNPTTGINRCNVTNSWV